MTAETEVEALRAATREAHEAIKDLRAAVREARAVTAEVRRVADEEVGARIEAALGQGLSALEGSIGEAIEDSTARVHARFDKVADLLMGEDGASRRRGDPSLTEMARALAEGRRR